ncbi:MAG: hypothetical protein JWQ09_5040 [Segetibacter sp.]|nr:hypothetical protein [Segetibacter sp.]
MSETKLNVKEKVSSLEFAIMGYADPENIDKFEPYTKQEESQQRVDNLKRQFSRLNLNSIEPGKA